MIQFCFCQIGGSTGSMIAGDFWILTPTCSNSQTRNGVMTYITDKCITGRESSGFGSYWCNSTTIIRTKDCNSGTCTSGCATDAVWPTNTCILFGTNEMGLSVYANLTCVSSFTHPVLTPGAGRLNLTNGGDCTDTTTHYAHKTYFPMNCTSNAALPVPPGNGSMTIKAVNGAIRWPTYSSPNCTGVPQNDFFHDHFFCENIGPTYIFVTEIYDPIPVGKSTQNITSQLFYSSTGDPSTYGGLFVTVAEAHYPFTPYPSATATLICYNGSVYEKACSDTAMTQNCASTLQSDDPGILSFNQTDEFGTNLYWGPLTCKNTSVEPGGVSKYQLYTNCATSLPSYRYNTNQCTWIPSLSNSTQNVSRVYFCNGGKAAYNQFVSTNGLSDCSSQNSSFATSISVGQCMPEPTDQVLLTCMTPYVCFGISSNLLSVCSGNGASNQNDMCNCKPGWHGVKCEIMNPPLPMFGSTGIVTGNFWLSGNCSNGPPIGALSYITDTCIQRNQTSLVFGCNSTHILVRNCPSPAACNAPVGCTSTVYLHGTCFDIDFDSNGYHIYANLTCSDSSFSHLPLALFEALFNVSQTCALPNAYSQRKYYPGCHLNGVSSVSTSCSNTLFNWTETSGNTCQIKTTSAITNQLTCMDTAFSEAVTLVGCDTLYQNPSTDYIVAPTYLDSNCRDNTTISGNLVYNPSVASRSIPVGSFYVSHFCTNAKTVRNRYCSDIGMQRDCADTGDYIQDLCSSGPIDDAGAQLYTQYYNCMNSQSVPKPGRNFQFVTFGGTCSDGVNPVFLNGNVNCVHVPFVTNPGYNTSRIYGCGVNGTFYSEWYSDVGVSNCTGSPNVTVNTNYQLQQCQNTSSYVLTQCTPGDIPTCSGIPATDPNVCSGRGICISRDACSCYAGYIGFTCQMILQDIPPNTVFNLTGSVSGTTLNVGNTSSIVISSISPVKMVNSSLSVAGAMSIQSGTLNLAGTTISILPGGTLTIGGNSVIIGDGKSTLQLAGTASVNSTGGGKTTILIKIVNQGSFEIVGSGIVNFTNSVTQSETASFASLTSNIFADNGLTFTNGKVALSGNVTSTFLTIVDSLVSSPKGLNVVGHMNLNSTMIFNIDSISQLNQLSVSKTFNLYSVVILKLGPNFAPSIGDQLDIIPAAADFLINGNFILMGGASKTKVSWGIDAGVYPGDLDVGHRNARDVWQVTSKKLKIVVTYSIGDDKSVCHYLGAYRNLEYYLLDKQASISFVVPSSPTVSTGYVIGWNDQPVLDTNKLVYFTNSTLDVVVQTNTNFLLDSVIKIIPQIFGLGPAYKIISVLIPKRLIVNQTYLFYYQTTSPFNIQNTTSISPEVFAFQIGSQSTVDCTNFVTPFRAETYSLPGLVILLAIYVVMFICCLFYSIGGAQPLRSRGISPYFVLFFCFVQLITEIRDYFYPPTSQASLCLFYAYLYYPALQTCYIVILFYYVRYFLIINLNEIKNSVKDTDDSIKKSVTRIRLIKILLSKWVIIGYLAFAYVLVNLLFTIVLASNKYVCSFNVLLTLKILHCIELIVIYFMILSATIFDMGMNFAKFKRGQVLNYIFTSDPFYFRVQIILFMFYLMYQFVIDIVVLVLTSTYIAAMTNYYLIAVLNTVSCLFLVVIDVWFPLVLTMWHYFFKFIDVEFHSPLAQFPISIRRKYYEEESKNIIVTILSDEKGHDLFLNFSKTEFSVENIKCWDDIQKFKADPTMALAVEVQKTYLMGALSPMEINIATSQAKQVSNAIETNAIDSTLFAEIERVLMVNITDTYFRFQYTNRYKNYALIKNTQKEMLDLHAQGEKPQRKQTTATVTTNNRMSTKQTELPQIKSEEKQIEPTVEKVVVKEEDVVEIVPTVVGSNTAPITQEVKKTVLWTKKPKAEVPVEGEKVEVVTEVIPHQDLQVVDTSVITDVVKPEDSISLLQHEDIKDGIDMAPKSTLVGELNEDVEVVDPSVHPNTTNDTYVAPPPPPEDEDDHTTEAPYVVKEYNAPPPPTDDEQ
jgi:hypothetical protein